MTLPAQVTVLALAFIGLCACPPGFAGGGQGPRVAHDSGPGAPRPITDVTAAHYPAPLLPRARVMLVDAYGGVHPVEVEVAATAAARTRGLMWRRTVPEGTGMLFIFPVEEELSFWMKNTLTPLDIIFISKDRRIVSIQERAEPLTLSPRPSFGPAQYVVEVAAGWSAKVGLRHGLPVTFEGLGGVAVTD